MHEHDHRGVDHQPVGERVGVLPELGLDVPAAGEPAVDLVGGTGNREDDRRRPAVPSVRLRERTMKTGIRTKRAIVSAFGICAARGVGAVLVATVSRIVPGRGPSGTRTSPLASWR